MASLELRHTYFSTCDPLINNTRVPGRGNDRLLSCVKKLKIAFGLQIEELEGNY